MDEYFSDSNRFLDYATGDPAALYEQIAEGEHQRQDFKFRIDSAQKIAKTLSAFANTGGGKLLIGVKDNGRITGIDPEEEYYMIEGAAERYCRPAVPFSAQVYETEDGRVLEIAVADSGQRPHLVKDSDEQYRAYLRQDDENFAASKAVLRYLRDKKPQSARKNMVAYGPIEQALFELFSQHTLISISQFCRKAKIPIYKGEKTLALFLKWQIIDWHATDKGIRYRLREQP